MYHFNNSCKTCSKNQVKRLYKKLVFYCIGIIIINTKWHTRANITLKRISECPFLTQNQVKELIKRIYTLEIKKKNLGLNKKGWDFFFFTWPQSNVPIPRNIDQSHCSIESSEQLKGFPPNCTIIIWRNNQE